MKMGLALLTMLLDESVGKEKQRVNTIQDLGQLVKENREEFLKAFAELAGAFGVDTGKCVSVSLRNGSYTARRRVNDVSGGKSAEIEFSWNNGKPSGITLAFGSPFPWMNRRYTFSQRGFRNETTGQEFFQVEPKSVQDIIEEWEREFLRIGIGRLAETKRVAELLLKHKATWQDLRIAIGDH
jgi:hypothetical protein